MSTSEQVLLSVKDLTVTFPVFGGFFRKQIGAVRAVTNVNFQVKRGETLGIVGESGCGKTTLGRAIVRLYKPTSGAITFNGTDISNQSDSQLKPIRKNLQMIFQDPYGSLNPRMNVAAILEEPMVISGGFTREQRQSRVRELMELVGLRPELMNRYPHEFSGGQRQRIGIARSLTLNPEMIVCDEAVSALDVSIQAQVINLLVDLQKKLGLTYIFIAHDLAVVQYVSDRIAVMYLGRVVEMGTSHDICTKPIHPYTKALLGSIPARHPSQRKAVEPLAGDVPSPMNPPSGCAFHPRCPFATAKCREQIPEPRMVQLREVACHHAETVASKSLTGRDA